MTNIKLILNKKIMPILQKPKTLKKKKLKKKKKTRWNGKKKPLERKEIESSPVFTNY